MITINNILDLKNFVLQSTLSLNNKTTIVNSCINVFIIGNVKNENELIELIQKNCNNQYKKVILGKGINPFENGNQ
jgi:hypothetical protein